MRPEGPFAGRRRRYPGSAADTTVLRGRGMPGRVREEIPRNSAELTRPPALGLVPFSQAAARPPGPRPLSSFGRSPLLQSYTGSPAVLGACSIPLRRLPARVASRYDYRGPALGLACNLERANHV